MTSASEVLNRKAAANHIGVSPTTFDRLRTAGEIPAPIRLSERRIGWKTETLDAWLEARKAVAA